MLHWFMGNHESFNKKVHSYDVLNSLYANVILNLMIASEIECSEIYSDYYKTL